MTYFGYCFNKLLSNLFMSASLGTLAHPLSLPLSPASPTLLFSSAPSPQHKNVFQSPVFLKQVLAQPCFFCKSRLFLALLCFLT